MAMLAALLAAAAAAAPAAALRLPGPSVPEAVKDDRCKPIQPGPDAQFQEFRYDGIPRANITNTFSISLCWEPPRTPARLSDPFRAARLSGHFRIAKRLGCLGTARGPAQGLWADGSTAAEVAAEVGEDEFIFVLEGPEVISLQPRPSEALFTSCIYEFPFDLTVPGRYRLNLVWTRSGFLGTRETVSSWPPCHFDLPLGAHAFVELGSGYTGTALVHARRQRGLPHCTATGPDAPQGGRWVSQKDKDWILGSQSHLVRCSQWAPPADNGRSTPMAWPAPPGPAAVEAESTSAASASLSGESSLWHREDGCAGYMESGIDFTRYEWRPHGCRARRFSRKAAAACLQHRRLLLRGDSHMRKLFETMTKFACNSSLSAKGRQSVCLDDLDLVGSCGSSPRICFEVDPMGERTEGIADYNLVVANFGQHPASGTKQMTLAQYKSAVDAYVAKVAAELHKLPPGSPRFAWHETNAMPFRNDHMVNDRRDWRTPQRLALYNAYSTKAFASIGTPIVEAFAPTLAASLHAEDVAHFPGAVLMPMVHRVLDLLCPA